MNESNWPDLSNPEKLLQNHSILWQHLTSRRHQESVAALSLHQTITAEEWVTQGPLTEPDGNSIASSSQKDVKELEEAPAMRINTPVSLNSFSSTPFETKTGFFDFEVLSELRRSIASEVLRRLHEEHASLSRRDRKDSAHTEKLGRWDSSPGEERETDGLGFLGSISLQVLAVCRDSAYASLANPEKHGGTAVDIYLAALDALLNHFAALPPLSLQQHTLRPEFSSQLQSILHLLAETCENRLQDSSAPPVLPQDNETYFDSTPEDLVFWKTLQVQTVIVLATGSVGHMLVLSSTLLSLSVMHPRAPIHTFPVLEKCIVQFKRAYSNIGREQGISDLQSDAGMEVVVLNSHSEVQKDDYSCDHLTHCGKMQNVVVGRNGNFAVQNDEGGLFFISNAPKCPVNHIHNQMLQSVVCVANACTTWYSEQDSKNDAFVAVSEENIAMLVEGSSVGGPKLSLLDIQPPKLTSPRFQVSKVCSGKNHVLFQTAGGCVFGVGSNEHGQCGVSVENVRSLPTPKLVMDDNGELSSVSNISAGAEFSLFVTSAGDLFGCGDHSVGQLGLGRRHASPVRQPKRVFIDSPGCQVIQVASGEAHSLVLARSPSKEQTVYVFGADTDSQCCASNSAEVSVVWVPTQANLETGVPIKQVACQANLSAALSDEGKIFVWGKASGTNSVPIASPMQPSATRNRKAAFISLGVTQLFVRYERQENASDSLQTADVSQDQSDSPFAPLTLEHVFDYVVATLGIVVNSDCIKARSSTRSRAAVAEDQAIINNVRLVLSQLMLKQHKSGHQDIDVQMKTKTLQQVSSLLNVLHQIFSKWEQNMEYFKAHFPLNDEHSQVAKAEGSCSLRDILCSLCFDGKVAISRKDKETEKVDNWAKRFNGVDEAMIEELRHEALSILGEAFPLIFETCEEQVNFLLSLLDKSMANKVKASGVAKNNILNRLPLLVNDQFWMQLFHAYLYTKSTEEEYEQSARNNNKGSNVPQESQDRFMDYNGDTVMELVKRLISLACRKMNDEFSDGSDVSKSTFFNLLDRMQLGFLTALREGYAASQSAHDHCILQLTFARFIEQLFECVHSVCLDEKNELTHIRLVVKVLQPFTSYCFARDLPTFLTKESSKAIEKTILALQQVLMKNSLPAKQESLLDSQLRRAIVDLKLSLCKIFMEGWFGHFTNDEASKNLYSSDESVNTWMTSFLFRFGLCEATTSDATTGEKAVTQTGNSIGVPQVVWLEQATAKLVHLIESLSPLSGVNKVRFRNKVGVEEVWKAHKLVFLAILWHHPHSFDLSPGMHLRMMDPSDEGKRKVSSFLVDCWKLAMRMLNWLSRHHQLTGECYSTSAAHVSHQASLLLSLNSATGKPKRLFLRELREFLEEKDATDKISKQTASNGITDDATHESSIYILKFSQQRNSMELRNLLSRRQVAARLRSQGYEAISDLLKRSKHQGTVRYLLDQLEKTFQISNPPTNLFSSTVSSQTATGFQSHQVEDEHALGKQDSTLDASKTPNRHFLQHMGGIGIDLEKQLQQSFFDLVKEYFVNHIGNLEDTEMNSRLLEKALSIATLEYTPDDGNEIHSSGLVELLTKLSSLPRLEQLIEDMKLILVQPKLDDSEESKQQGDDVLEIWKLKVEQERLLCQGETVWSSIHAHSSLAIQENGTVISSPPANQSFSPPSPLTARLARGYLRGQYAVLLTIPTVEAHCEALDENASILVGVVSMEHNRWDSLGGLHAEQHLPSLSPNAKIVVWMDMDHAVCAIFAKEQAEEANEFTMYSRDNLVSTLALPALASTPLCLSVSILSHGTSIKVRPFELPPGPAVSIWQFLRDTREPASPPSRNSAASSQDDGEYSVSDGEYSVSDGDTNASGLASDSFEGSSDSGGLAGSPRSRSSRGLSAFPDRVRWSPAEEPGCVGPLGDIVEKETETSVFVFGQNSQGELGLSPKVKHQKEPALSAALTALAPVQVVAGNEVTAVLTRTGHVYTVGYNKVGTCATGRCDRGGGVQPAVVRVPTRVVGLCGVLVKKICASNGCEQIFAITTQGDVYAWGYNKYGQLGIGQTNDVVVHPRAVEELGGKGVCAVSNSYSHTLALTQAGQVYAFGLNSKGQLGIGSHRNMYARPRLVTRLAEIGRVRSIAVGAEHSAVCTEAGNVYTFGRNNYGQLGIGTSSGVGLMPVPTQVVNGPSRLRSLRCQAVACGYYFTVVIAEGSLHSFGMNNYGQLGVGHTKTCFSPTPVAVAASRSPPHFVSVSCGTGHVVACSSDGRVVSWGRNRFGGVGDGSLVDHPAPVQINAKGQLASLRKSSQIIQVATGFHHTVLLTGQLKDLKIHEMTWLPHRMLVQLNILENAWSLLKSILAGFRPNEDQLFPDNKIENTKSVPGDAGSIESTKGLSPSQTAVIEWLISMICSVDEEKRVSCSRETCKGFTFSLAPKSHLLHMFQTFESIPILAIECQYQIELLNLLFLAVSDNHYGAYFIEKLFSSNWEVVEILLRYGLDSNPSVKSIIALRILHHVLPFIDDKRGKSIIDDTFRDFDETGMILIGESTHPTQWVRCSSSSSTSSSQGRAPNSTRNNDLVPGVLSLSRLLKIIGSISFVAGATGTEFSPNSMQGGGEAISEATLHVETASPELSLKLRSSFEVLSELIALYRILLQSPNWKVEANLAVSSAVEFAPRFIEQLPGILKVYLEAQGLSEKMFDQSDSSDGVRRKYSMDSVGEPFGRGMKENIIESQDRETDSFVRSVGQDTFDVSETGLEMKSSAGTLSAIRKFVGMLNVLGGNTEVIREGGRVIILSDTTENKGQEGTVLWYKPGNRIVAQVKISYRGNTEVFNIRDVSELLPIAPTTIPVDSLELPHQILNMLVKVIGQEIDSPSMILGENHYKVSQEVKYQELINSGMLYVSLLHEMCRMSSVMVIHSILSQNPNLVRGFVARGHLPSIASLITAKSLHDPGVSVPMLQRRLKEAECMRTRALEVERAFTFFQLHSPAIETEGMSEVAYFSPDAAVSPQMVDGAFTGHMVRQPVTSESATWVCTHCTFENQVTVSRCQMCENKRTSRGTMASTPTPGAGEKPMATSVPEETGSGLSTSEGHESEIGIDASKDTNDGANASSESQLAFPSGTRFRKSYRPMVRVETGFSRSFDFDGTIPSVRFSTLRLYRFKTDSLAGISHCSTRPRWFQVPVDTWSQDQLNIGAASNIEEGGRKESSPLEKKSATSKHILRLLDSQFLAISHGFHRNGSERSVYLNQYTILLDILIPQDAWVQGDDFLAILQPDIKNEELATWYIRKDGRIGCVEYSDAGVVQPNKWHRICMSVDLGNHVVNYYVDGIRCTTLQGGESRKPQLLEDDRWSLDTEFFVGIDSSLDSAKELWVSNIQMRCYAMSEAEIAVIGPSTQSGIPEPNHHHLSIKLAQDLEVPRSWCVMALEEMGYNIGDAFSWIQEQEAVLIRRTRAEAVMLTALGFRQRECVDALCSTGSLANAIELLLSRAMATDSTINSNETVKSFHRVKTSILSALNQSQGNFNSNDLLSIDMAEDDNERLNRTYFIFPSSNQEVVESFAEEGEDGNENRKDFVLKPLHIGDGAMNLGEVVWGCAHDLFNAYAKLTTVAIIESSIAEPKGTEVAGDLLANDMQIGDSADTSTEQSTNWMFNDSVGGKHFLRNYLKAFPDSIRKDLAASHAAGDVSNLHDPIVVIRRKLWSMFLAEAPAAAAPAWPSTAVAALVEDALHELVLLAKGPWTLLPCGLQAGACHEFSEIWTDKHSVSSEVMDKVTRKKRREEQVLREPSVAVFRPFADSGFAVLGDVAVALPAAPAAMVVSDDDGFGDKARAPSGEPLLAPPQGFQRLWWSGSWACNQSAAVYRPIPPPGYAALGCVVLPDPPSVPPGQDPSLQQLRCVHESCVSGTGLVRGVWTLEAGEDRAEEASSATAAPAVAFWTVDNEPRTFLVRGAPARPMDHDLRGPEQGLGPSQFCFPQSEAGEEAPGWGKGGGGAGTWRSALATRNPRRAEKEAQEKLEMVPLHLGSAAGQEGTGSPELALWILQLLSEFDTVHGFGSFTRLVFSEQMLSAVLRFSRSATPSFRIKALRMVATVVQRAPLSAFTAEIRLELMNLKENMELMYSRQVAVRLDDEVVEEVALFSSLLCALTELFMAISVRYDAEKDAVQDDHVSSSRLLEEEEATSFKLPATGSMQKASMKVPDNSGMQEMGLNASSSSNVEQSELELLEDMQYELAESNNDVGGFIESRNVVEISEESEAVQHDDEEVKVVDPEDLRLRNGTANSRESLSESTRAAGLKSSYSLLRCQQPWFQQLEEMRTIMDALLHRDTFEMPTQFLMAEDTFMKLVLADKTAVHESNHPYSHQDASVEVCIPDAECLLVRFAKQCSTRFGDALQLRSDGKVLETLQGCFGGCTVHIPSNTFTYHFPLRQELNWALCTSGSQVKGPDIRVSNSGRTATLRRDKVWQTVFADSGFSCGINMWEVVVERTSGSGNIFFGVATVDAKAKGYLGSDDFGWGWIGCMACWHGGRKVKQPFGERLTTGDVIRVTLDIPRRALSIARNGKDMGVAFDRLPPPYHVRQPGGHLFPAFAFYNRDDKITLLSGSPSTITRAATVAEAACARPLPPPALASPLVAGGGLTGGQGQAISAKRAIAAGTLSNLGYPMAWCLRALEACDDDVNDAAEYLISNASVLEEESKSEEAARNAEVKLQIRAEEDRWLSDTARLLGLAEAEGYPEPSSSVQAVQVGPKEAAGDRRVRSSSLLSEDLSMRDGVRHGFSFSRPVETGRGLRKKGRLRRGSSVSSAGSSEAEPEWGFHFTVSPLFSRKVLNELSKQEQNEEKIARVRRLFRHFTLAKDSQLVQYVNERCDKLGVDSMSLSPEDVSFRHVDPIRFPLLVDQDLVTLQLRFLLLRNFNRRLASVLPLIDLSCADYESKLGASIRKLRGLILKPVKQTLFSRVLAESHCGDDHTVRKEKTPLAKIDRNRAAQFLKSGKCDIAGSRTVFGQIYQQLHLQLSSAAMLRNSHRAWYTVLVGESADDYGGPYRDVINQACQELMSAALPLFIPCPNARGQQGLCQEKWVPNPQAKSPTAIGMFEFVGKLMGIAMRTANPMAVYLPSITWKHICRDEVSLQDVAKLDKKLADHLARVLDADTPGKWAQLQASAECRFVTTTVDGGEVELVAGGEDILVPFHAREKLLKRVKEFKLQELMPQCAALARGLATQVPRHFLSLFTWEEMEQLVCGPAEVDVEVLRSNSTYGDGFSESHPTVQMFWDVLGGMDQQDRQRYLRFVWGRSRLPISAADWQRKHKLNVLKKERPNDYLPIGHTCFFTLDLPMYTSVDVCKEKLLYAVTHCVAIDADETTNARLAAEDGDWSNTGADDEN